jgi:gliding motility-associated-like protein
LKQKYTFILFCITCLFPWTSKGQDVSLYQQFNGRFDFVFFGNTLNTQENTFQTTPVISTSSAATLTLNSGDVIEKAFLYWAGSGTGDFDIKLNNQTHAPERNFTHQRIINGVTYDYFSAFKEVTSQIQTTGNGQYTVSDFDVSPFLAQHFQRKTNFAGWAIIVIYKNNSLPLNQLNVYDGLQGVPDAISITLNSLDVIDNEGAKIGFLAWEGDVGIQVNETLSINGNPIENLPLNPVNNAFNGTNSFTNSNTLYNMDLDVYSIQNNIAIGDNSALIELTSGQDFVMINAIVTKLNSQLPDATIAINHVLNFSCDSREIAVDYTVSNTNCTKSLPSGTPIAFYADSLLLQSTTTSTTIPIDGSETNQILLSIPATVSLNFTLKVVVDDAGNGSGIVLEILEDNNIDSDEVTLWQAPIYRTPENLISCNEGFGKGTFDFSSYDTQIKITTTDIIRYFSTLSDAENNINFISNTSNYITSSSPTTIYVRIENEHCVEFTSFQLLTKNCPPVVYNFVSVNGDGFNETFFVKGLRNVFLNYSTSIYNRWGVLVWKGNNNTPDWDGIPNQGLLIDSNEIPAGTYFYSIELNDPSYPEPLVGYLYLTR